MNGSDNVNPYYAAFCQAHNVGPYALPMYKFVLWMNEQWSRFEHEHNMPIDSSNSVRDRAKFETWLFRQVTTAGETAKEMSE